MNRRDLLKLFAASMAALPFIGKAESPRRVTFPHTSGSWGTVELNYIMLGDELIQITPNGLKRYSQSSTTGYKVADEGLHVFNVTTSDPITWGSGWSPLEEYKPPAE